MTTASKPRRSRTNRVKLIVQSPSDRYSTILLPYAVAFAAARGIARDTHYVAFLIGERGTARFAGDGSGTVDWADDSPPTRFGANTTVCI